MPFANHLQHDTPVLPVLVKIQRAIQGNQSTHKINIEMTPEQLMLPRHPNKIARQLGAFVLLHAIIIAEAAHETNGRRRVTAARQLRKPAGHRLDPVKQFKDQLIDDASCEPLGSVGRQQAARNPLQISTFRKNPLLPTLEEGLPGWIWPTRKSLFVTLRRTGGITGPPNELGSSAGSACVGEQNQRLEAWDSTSSGTRLVSKDATTLLSRRDPHGRTRRLIGWHVPM